MSKMNYLAVVNYTNPVDKTTLVDVLTYETISDMNQDLKDFKNLHDVKSIKTYQMSKIDIDNFEEVKK